ncbi:phage tail fiber repeat family protein [Escherichia coli 2-156-04_S3_C1]|nr:phage tail fiber repeat family protein [Escherichia coli 2-156-04_S3_C1]
MALEDASTTKKGIVQLSSATNSTSETLAATPKAVKAANDNANDRVMAIAAAPGTAVLLIRLRFSTACSRPFMAIHPPFSGDG